jgi:hypothetical protein
MRKFALLFVCIVCSLKSFSQEGNYFNTEASDSTNVYYKALSDFCKYVEKVFPNVSTVYIERSVLNTWLPNKIGKFNFHFLDEKDIIKLHSEKKKVVYFTRVVPIRVAKDFFYVNIIPFRVEVPKKGELKLINSGAIQSKFTYDCRTGKFSYIGVGDGGFSEIE